VTAARSLADHGDDRQMALADVSDDLIRLRVIGAAGQEGEVHLNSRYDRPTTARLLRQIADDYEASR
jgi:hypothetical protein